MNPLSWTYLVFCALCVGLYWALPSARPRRALLVAATAVWFAWAAWWHVVVALAMATTTWAFARWIAARDEARRGAPLALGVLSLLGYFFVFRYLALWTGHDPRQGPLPWWAPNPLLAPLGLSFMMFEGIAHLADLYLGRAEVAGSWWSHVCFAFFFPSRVIGPLRRYQSFTADLEASRPPTPDEAAGAIRQIAVGVAKKAVLANPLGAFGFFNLDPVLVTNGARVPLALGAVAFWGYLFFDLSGYSDMVIGVGRLFGVTVPPNFDRPYVADTISDYWNRWHMSLSGWVRDYVFTPLAIRWRAWPFGAPAASFTSMVVLGLWHGLELRYLVFGAWHGALLAGYMLYREWAKKKKLAKRLAKNRAWSVAGWCFVALNAVVTHVLFAVPDAATFWRWLSTVAVGR